MICPNCQFQNPEGAKFCQNCGAQMTVPTQPPIVVVQPPGQEQQQQGPPVVIVQPQQKSSRWKGCCLGVLGGVLVILLLLFFLLPPPTVRAVAAAYDWDEDATALERTVGNLWDRAFGVKERLKNVGVKITGNGEDACEEMADRHTLAYWIGPDGTLVVMSCLNEYIGKDIDITEWGVLNWTEWSHSSSCVYGKVENYTNPGIMNFEVNVNFEDCRFTDRMAIPPAVAAQDGDGDQGDEGDGNQREEDEAYDLCQLEGFLNMYGTYNTADGYNVKCDSNELDLDLLYLSNCSSDMAIDGGVLVEISGMDFSCDLQDCTIWCPDFPFLDFPGDSYRVKISLPDQRCAIFFDELEFGLGKYEEICVEEEETSDRCDLFDNPVSKWVVFEPPKGSTTFTSYFMFPDGVPGLEYTVSGDDGEWEYMADLGGVEATCSFEGYDGRLYCTFDVPKSMLGTQQELKLYVNNCSYPIYEHDWASVPEGVTQQDDSSVCPSGEAYHPPNSVYPGGCCTIGCWCTLSGDSEPGCWNSCAGCPP